MPTANPFTNGELTLPLRHPDVVHCVVEDGAVLLHTREEVYYGLNEVGSRVWELLPPRTPTPEAFLLALAATYPDVDPEVLRTDVWDLLAQLLEFGLVVPPSTPDGASETA